MKILRSFTNIAYKSFTGPIVVFTINQQLNCDWFKIYVLQNHAVATVYYNCTSLDFMSKTANFCQEIPLSNNMIHER